MAQHAQDPPPPPPAMDPPPYDYMQPPPPDFAAAMQMAHLPLPLDTPLPPSSYDFTAHGAFPMPHPAHGPQAHPLFEGVLAMHHMLGHDLNLSWPDVADCSSQSLSYAASSSAPYASTEPIDAMPHWATPPPPIMDPTPSPLDESPEHIIELVSEPVAHRPQEPELDFEPSPSPIQRQPTGFAMFPLVVAGAKTHEHTIAFQADRQKSEKATSKLDPFAAGFIREKLGDQRWAIFSSRLAERRTTSQKPKTRTDGGANDHFGGADKASGSASVVDFLVKVEVVKSVLRTFVPHPYNPLKTLSHAYADAPSGQVTLSRTTVLTLSGWSNTQFSYWARRAEAISVLAMHDGRLRTVATALQRRLQSSGLAEAVADADAPSSSQPRATSARIDFGGLTREEQLDPEEWVRTYVTGKGLDVIIDEVKKRTGVSPFLRGKHSSLDPFGTVSVDGDGDGARSKAVVYMPTFQAEQYVHEVPSPTPAADPFDARRAGKRKASSPPHGESEGEDAWPSVASDVSGEDAMSYRTSSSRTHSASPPLYGAPHHQMPHPSAPFDRAMAHARLQLQYIDVAGHPQQHNSSQMHLAKKRRLAPSPVDSIPQSLATDPLGIYHNHHLQTG